MRTYDPGRTVEHPGSEVHFPPLANGLDYVLSVVELLEAGTERVSARDLKYAVLHLAAGVEVLLKARLQMEHWALVFKDPARAKRSELEDGTLNSCSPSEAVQRLRDIAGVAVSDKDAKALERLARHRNALQHYGLIGPAANARALESLAGEVLEFMVPFLAREVLSALSEDEYETFEEEFNRIRFGCHRIQGFVKKRMQRLSSVLTGQEYKTLRCPQCEQWAFQPIHDEPGFDGMRCAFCAFIADPQTAATEYALAVLRVGLQDLELGRRPVKWCPDCESPALIMGVFTAADPEQPVNFCFACGAVVPDLFSCARCELPYRGPEKQSLCVACSDRSADWEELL
ncbi:hypothetical protein ABZZ20_06435 [Streptomyces sp. NPDC006430]|uniref:hypothetical protein n=1 Tax=Streptomyces sp. NPDC006430 TaxID=3154299 RepID=UPI0033A9F36E